MQRPKRSSARLLALARRARKIAKGHSGVVAELYQEHAAICENKAALQKTEARSEKDPTGLNRAGRSSA